MMPWIKQRALVDKAGTDLQSLAALEEDRVRGASSLRGRAAGGLAGPLRAGPFYVPRALKASCSRRLQPAWEDHHGTRAVDGSHPGQGLCGAARQDARGAAACFGVDGCLRPRAVPATPEPGRAVGVPQSRRSRLLSSCSNMHEHFRIIDPPRRWCTGAASSGRRTAGRATPTILDLIEVRDGQIASLTIIRSRLAAALSAPAWPRLTGRRGRRNRAALAMTV